MDHDINRVLMALCNLEGIWDGSMVIPNASRVLLVVSENGEWITDERGYPVATPKLIQECEQLHLREVKRKAAGQQ
jgi:hypothetical protein